MIRMKRAILLVSCVDQKGITASVTDFVFQRGGNILHAAQHTDSRAGVFFMRVEWDLEGFLVSREQLFADVRGLASRFGMIWKLSFTDEVARAAVFVSHQLHCLHDLLFRHNAGQFGLCRFDLVVSNHPDAKATADRWGIDFLHIPVSADTKAEAEAAQIKALDDRGINLVILARYHQILSPAFVARFPNQIINIHHSFLPAFAGAAAYAQAYEKGVKIIGATSHYVTAELDQGPILEQDTARIDHTYAIEDMVETGQDLERVVLSRAVRWHLESRVLCYGNKTIIFD